MWEVWTFIEELPKCKAW